jgi:hypothetical protein
MDKQAKINKDTFTKFKAMEKILDIVDGKMTKVGISIHQILNTMEMLEAQVENLARRSMGNKGRLPGH